MWFKPGDCVALRQIRYLSRHCLLDRVTGEPSGYARKEAPAPLRPATRTTVTSIVCSGRARRVTTTIPGGTAPCNFSMTQQYSAGQCVRRSMMSRAGMFHASSMGKVVTPAFVSNHDDADGRARLRRSGFGLVADTWGGHRMNPERRRHHSGHECERVTSDENSLSVTVSQTPVRWPIYIQENACACRLDFLWLVLRRQNPRYPSVARCFSWNTTSHREFDAQADALTTTG